MKTRSPKHDGLRAAGALIESVAEGIWLRLKDKTHTSFYGFEKIVYHLSPTESPYRDNGLFIEIIQSPQIPETLHVIACEERAGSCFSKSGVATFALRNAPGECTFPVRHTRCDLGHGQWETTLRQWLASVLASKSSLIQHTTINDAIMLYRNDALRMRFHSVIQQMQFESSLAWEIYAQRRSSTHRERAAIGAGALIEVLQELGYYKAAANHVGILFNNLAIATSSTSIFDCLSSLYKLLSVDTADSIAAAYLNRYRPGLLTGDWEKYFEVADGCLHSPARKSDFLLRLWISKVARQTDREFEHFRSEYEKCARGTIDTSEANLLGMLIYRAVMRASLARRTVDRLRHLEVAYRYTREGRRWNENFRLNPTNEAHMMTHVLLHTIRQEVDLLRRIALLRQANGRIQRDLFVLAEWIEQFGMTVGVRPEAVSAREYGDLQAALPRIEPASPASGTVLWATPETLHGETTAIDHLLSFYDKIDSLADLLGYRYG